MIDRITNVEATAPAPGATCALCARKLDGAYLRDPRGQFFCGAHTLVACRFCERGYDPGRGAAAGSCPSCEAVAVVRAEEASARYKIVADWYRSNALPFAAGPPPFGLKDRMPLAPNGRPMLGYAEKWTQGGGAGSTAVRSISVQSGLPRFLFGVVAAHELGHAYLAQRSAKLPERTEEGICDWLAHAFAQSIATDDMKWTARRIEINPDPVNGEGFRRFRAFADEATPGDLPRLLSTLAQS